MITINAVRKPSGFIAAIRTRAIFSTVAAISLQSSAQAASVPEVELPQFQVGGMLCGAESIEIAAHDKLYRVVLDANGRPQRYEVLPLQRDDALLRRFVSPQVYNLGPQAPSFMRAPRSIELVRGDSGNVVRPEIEVIVLTPDYLCRVRIRSRLVAVNSRDEETDSRVLYEGLGWDRCEVGD